MGTLRRRDLLFQTMDSQLYDDGGHVEQSPSYSAVITGWLVETKLLDGPQTATPGPPATPS